MYNRPMSDSPIAHLLQCTQCGGELHPDEGQIFLTCPYCSSSVYVDKSRVVFHWYVTATLDETKARTSLARWMAGNQTVKDLDQKSQVVSVVFEYFPMWYFKRRMPDGKEQISLVLAAATSVSELMQLRLPAGDLRKYDTAIDAQAHPPSMPLDTALAWMRDNHGEGVVSEQALVHIPLYPFRYAYQGKTYMALVEGATGEVFANIYPAKAEAPYQLIGLVTAAVFLCLALLPIIGALVNIEMFGFGLAACVGIGVLLAPILFGIAVWIAAKI
jgi:predicted RNA-binding Zn-ribbon protein involved in translation (DUF1610 family)